MKQSQLLQQLESAGLRRPGILTLAITGACNLNCCHCWVKAGEEASFPHVPLQSLLDRRASTPDEALATLRSDRKLFDPVILDGFIGIMSLAPVPVVTAAKSTVTATGKTINNDMLIELRRKMRSSINDRNALLKLHSLITDNINNGYGEEKAALVELRLELKNLLNSLYAADRLELD